MRLTIEIRDGNLNTKKITEYGFLLAIALTLAYFENLIGFAMVVPGTKIGFANIITMLMLYRTNFNNTFLFMILRVLLSGLLFSGLAGILYSLAGGFLCILIMNFVKKFSFFSMIGVSMLGAIFHNIGQLIVAVIVMENIKIFYYFPVLFGVGVLTGIGIGYVSAILIKNYNEIFPKD